MDFYEKHSSDREFFEIIALHSAKDVKTFAELDSKITPKVHEAWKGKQLPFPVLLDATHQSFDNYGIDVLPTTILIDPQGKLWGYGDERILEKKLQEAKKK